MINPTLSLAILIRSMQLASALPLTTDGNNTSTIAPIKNSTSLSCASKYTITTHPPDPVDTKSNLTAPVGKGPTCFTQQTSPISVTSEGCLIPGGALDQIFDLGGGNRLWGEIYIPSSSSSTSPSSDFLNTTDNLPPLNTTTTTITNDKNTYNPWLYTFSNPLIPPSPLSPISPLSPSSSEDQGANPFCYIKVIGVDQIVATFSGRDILYSVEQIFDVCHKAGFGGLRPLQKVYNSPVGVARVTVVQGWYVQVRGMDGGGVGVGGCGGENGRVEELS